MSSVADPSPAIAAPRGGQPLRRLLRDPMGLLGLILVAAFLAMALFAPWAAPYDPLKIDVANKLKPPSMAHWAGTDQLGRDTLSRLIWGARTALAIALTATSLAGVIGLALGLIAGYVPAARAAFSRASTSPSIFAAASSRIPGITCEYVSGVIQTLP